MKPGSKDKKPPTAALHGAAGYAHPAYASALEEFGFPRRLPRSGGWILERPIPRSERRDAMGCYPLFACADWSSLAADLEDLGSDLVSLGLVADPFGEPTPGQLRRLFPHACSAFKEHFVRDLSIPEGRSVSSRHRRNARRALRELQVELCDPPAAYLDDWVRLYDWLIARHEISGIAAFSKDSLRKQLAVPGLVALRASRDGETVSMLLWYVQGDVAYYHLGASSPTGYAMRASFALFWRSIEHFADAGLRWLDLGGAAGVSDAESGLREFKSGWATGTRTAYFCGRIFDPRAYEQLRLARGKPSGDYFPAYRSGEFG